MAITRQKKEEVVAKVADIAGKAKTLVFANFKGLTVAEANELRRTLRTQGVGYTVAKKSLIRRALSGSAVEGEMPALEGEIALAYGEDELAPARELAVFVKKFGEHLSLAGGIFGGKYMDAQGITAIATIPPMEVLRAQFAQLINSPLQRFAVVVNEGAKKKQ